MSPIRSTMRARLYINSSMGIASISPGVHAHFSSAAMLFASFGPENAPPASLDCGTVRLSYRRVKGYPDHFVAER